MTLLFFIIVILVAIYIYSLYENINNTINNNTNEHFGNCGCKLVYVCSVNKHLQRKCKWVHH